MASKLISEAIEMLGKESVDALQATAKSQKWTKSRLNTEIRNSMKGMAGDMAAREAIENGRYVQGADGQMTLAGMAPSPKVSAVEDAVEQVQSSGGVQGQVSMFADSTGQMHTSGTKIRQIKEARKSANLGKMQSRLRSGEGGQMYMDLGGGMKDPYTVKSGKSDVVSQAVDTVDNSPIPGQDSFMVDKNGFLSSTESVRDMRRAEVKKANRNWAQRRLDGAAEAWTGFKTGANDIVTGKGDASKRIAGRKTREAERIKANENYILTGEGSAQSKRDFYRNYKKPQTVEDPTASTNPADYEEISDIAQEAAESGAGWWDGLGDWVHENQLVAAGGIAGVGLLGGGALIALGDDDD